MRKNQHVVPNNEKWAVKGSGNEKFALITPTQFQAIEKEKRLQKIYNQSYLSMGGMVKSEQGKVISMFRFHQLIEPCISHVYINL